MARKKKPPAEVLPPMALVPQDNPRKPGSRVAIARDAVTLQPGPPPPWLPAAQYGIVAPARAKKHPVNLALAMAPRAKAPRPDVQQASMEKAVVRGDSAPFAAAQQKAAALAAAAVVARQKATAAAAAVAAAEAAAAAAREALARHNKRAREEVSE